VNGDDGAGINRKVRSSDERFCTGLVSETRQRRHFSVVLTQRAPIIVAVFAGPSLSPESAP